MESQQYRDLAKLARKRTREAAMTVTQLLDGDADKAALLVSCAIDFINGACVMLADDEISEQEALGTVLGMIFSTIGLEEVSTSLKSVRLKTIRREQCSGD